ncbi:hypothetical protein ACFV4N_37170 [Actinosynnema sp. NPDC059797]
MGAEPWWIPPDTDNPAEFVAALGELRRRTGLSYRELERRASRAGDVLPTSTLNTALTRNTLPSKQVVVAFLRAAGATADTVTAWTAARAALAADRAPATTAAVTREDGRPAGPPRSALPEPPSVPDRAAPHRDVPDQAAPDQAVPLRAVPRQATPRPATRPRHRAALPTAAAVLCSLLLAVLAASTPDRRPATGTDADGDLTRPATTSQVTSELAAPPEETATGEPVNAVVDDRPPAVPQRGGGDPQRPRPPVTTPPPTGTTTSSPLPPTTTPTPTTTVPPAPTTSSAAPCEPPTACTDPVGQTGHRARR